MYRYPEDIRHHYYRITFHHGSDIVHEPKHVPGVLRRYQDMHMGKGWGDIAYHYLIDQWGRIWTGRNLQYRGTHVGGGNTGNLGICFLADGRKEKLSMDAYHAGANLATWWSAYLNIDPKQILPHSAYGGTECPSSFIVPVIQAYAQVVSNNLRGDPNG